MSHRKISIREQTKLNIYAPGGFVISGMSDYIPSLHLVQADARNIRGCARAGNGAILFLFVRLQPSNPAAQTRRQDIDFITHG
jgi:hypothetical protein